MNTLELEVREYLGKGLQQSDEKVDLVCYCSVGYRSSIVAEQILKLKEDGQLPCGLRPVNLDQYSNGPQREEASHGKDRQVFLLK